MADDTDTRLPLSNAPKPAANTFASIDDDEEDIEISALSRHAGKIRLDDVKQSQEREKDKADRATSEQVLDPATRMILLKLINRGIISEVHGAVSTGKEANVYEAVQQPPEGGPIIRRAVKIYKTAILEFKDREKYIVGDHRFRNGVPKGDNKQMVKLWAEKEFRNLQKLHAAGIPCPEPIHLRGNVLVMGFLGDKRGWAYPRLRDADVSGGDGGDGSEDAEQQQWRSLYIQLLGHMRRICHVCKLVHADLSEYNILYDSGTLYIIDVSQSVGFDHPRSLEFLRMDIKNVGDFFRRRGVDTLRDRAVFNFITAPDGPVEEPEMSKAIEHLYEIRPPAADTEQALAEMEVDNEVFRNQYIPQTLEQVYDVEKEGIKIGEGLGTDLVYRNLLADQVVLSKAGEGEKEGGSSEDEESDSGAPLGSDEKSSEDEDGERFDKGRPRGRKFEDKDEKKQHKQAVKEEKRQRRKEKMPKHVKKRLVATTSRKK